MMKKETIIRIASVLGVVTILYLVYRKVVRPIVKEDEVDGGSSEETTTTTTTTTTNDSGYEKYVVTTKSTPLNVRETPSANGKKIGKLDKGQEVLLKKSTTDGWMELTTNGKVTMGYVSAQYVTKK